MQVKCQMYDDACDEAIMTTVVQEGIFMNRSGVYQPSALNYAVASLE